MLIPDVYKPILNNNISCFTPDLIQGFLIKFIVFPLCYIVGANVIFCLVLIYLKWRHTLNFVGMTDSFQHKQKLPTLLSCYLMLCYLKSTGSDFSLPTYNHGIYSLAQIDLVQKMSNFLIFE